MTRNIFGRAAMMLLVCVLTAATAWAKTVSNVPYVDADGIEQTATYAAVVTSDMGGTSNPNFNSGSTNWFYVNSDVTLSGAYNTGTSTQNIILGDGATLTISGQFKFGYASVNIYCQSGGTGKLVVSATYTGDLFYIGSNHTLTINGGTVEVTNQNYGNAFSGNLVMNGGTASFNGKKGFAMYAIFGTVTLNGGTFTATSNDYASEGICNSYVTIADGKYFKDGSGNIYYGSLSNAQKNALNGVTLSPATQTEYIQACLGTGNDGSASKPYTISDAAGWDAFCLALEDNDTWNRFSGKTVKLEADIEVSRLAGGDSHDFCGTFDGGGHTLTFNYGESGNPTSVEYVAPFSYVSNTKANTSDTNNSPATIKNLHVTGDIYTKAKYAAGIVGVHWGTLNIENCRSSIVIHSSVINDKGNDGTHGGIEAVSSGDLYITGCVFDGKLLTTNGTTNCGGFVGWRAAETIYITNSLYAPNVVEGDTWVSAEGSSTFARNGDNNTIITNSYYTHTLGTAQGKHPRTVTAGDNVTVEAVSPVGSPVENGTYSVSGITAYSGGGLQRGQTLYYGSGDQLSLTLSNSATGAPDGYRYDGYTASAGTLSGTTLTMPDEDVTISVNTAALAPIDWATVNQGNSTDPYMIYNKDQLNLLAHRVNGTHGETANDYYGKYFKLGADITFSHPDNEGDDYAENYEAIGGTYNGTDRYFCGTFDGDGHTVSGIRIRKTGSSIADSCQGLFGCIDSGADIHDVHLTDARITGYDCVGGIVGYNYEGYIMRCTVTDSYITATSNLYYGTVCGWNGGTLTNNYYHGCTVNGTAVTSGMGCEGADIAANNGALPAYAITLGANITTPPGTFVGQTEWLDTPPVGARLAPENGFTLAGNHYFASGYEFTPGSTLASGAAQGYTPRATLGDELLDLYTHTGDAPDYTGTAIARLTVTADCDGKTLAAALRSDGLQHEVSYVDANGNGHTAQAIALDGTEYSIDAGIYFVGLPEVNFTHTLNLEGNVTLILKDGCAMNVGTDAEKISATGIDGSDYAIDIYAQSLGNDKGTLAIYTKGTNHRGISVGDVNVNGGNVNVNNGAQGIFARGDITVNGGSVTVNSTGTNDAIQTPKGDITINGGTVNATGTKNGIYAAGSIAICGGIVEATGGASGISANNGITLGWNKPTDRIYASSYSGTVSVKDGLAFVTDKATPAVIGGTISDLAAINGKTLKPATFYLVGNMTNPEWTVNADYQLTVNPGNTSELMIQNVPLTGSTEFKVVYSANGTESTTWYPGDGYNYWISADGIYDIYFRPDYQGGDDWHYGCIYATDVSTVEVTFAPAGFCTYYHGKFDVKLPEGVKARIVTARGDSEGTLTYETIADGDTNDKVVPAGTAVMLQTEKSTEAQQKTLTLAVHDNNSPATPAVNLLHGSDVEGTTTGDGKHYKLTYGNDNTPNAEVFGWYWGAADGAAFTSPAHKAWLALPANASARSFFGLPDDDETTSLSEKGIVNSEQFLTPEGMSEQARRPTAQWYTLDGRKLDSKPTAKGIYVNNGRKVVIK